MASAVDIILKKLDQIEERLKNLEEEKSLPINKPTGEEKTTADSSLIQALALINQYEEISASQLASTLKISTKKAEEIMDQLEKLGLGTCYTKEV